MAPATGLSSANLTDTIGGVQDYWNHNAAYHRWILRAAAEDGVRNALDVGCGDGLLMQRLAATGVATWGIEPDPPTAERARIRLLGTDHTTVLGCTFDDYLPGQRRFDLITFVASVHHMDTRSALARAASLLNPGGRLLVVGLSRNDSVADWAFSLATLPWARLGSWLHHETRDIGVPIAEPQESLAELRSMADEVLPGAKIRRGLYYRYLLSARAPQR